MEQPSDDTPSVTPCGRASSLREGAGKRSHSSCRSEIATLRAIFIAPTQLKSFLHSTIHRTTLPQSRFRSTAPSEREPESVPIHRAGRKPQRWRAIFIAPTKCAIQPGSGKIRGWRAIFIAPTEAGAQRRDWRVAIWVVASSRALSQKALSVRSIPATRAVASAVATVVVCSSFLYTGTKSGPCWRYLA